MSYLNIINFETKQNKKQNWLGIDESQKKQQNLIRFQQTNQGWPQNHILMLTRVKFPKFYYYLKWNYCVAGT